MHASHSRYLEMEMAGSGLIMAGTVVAEWRRCRRHLAFGRWSHTHMLITIRMFEHLNRYGGSRGGAFESFQGVLEEGLWS
jgi:hypothetical protein